MRFTDKDLDALLWEWAQMTINDHDSGYPNNYILTQRVDHGLVFVPDYAPHPKINHLANTIFGLNTELRNPIIGKYLLCMHIQRIAKESECHPSTVYRKFNQARGILLEEMRKFSYKNSRL